MSGSVDGHRVLVCSRANTGIMKDGREVNKLPSTSGVRDLMSHNGRSVTTVTAHTRFAIGV